jgi:iron(III) transport system permease protein
MNASKFYRATVIIIFSAIVLLPILFVLVTPFLPANVSSAAGIFSQRHLSLAKNSLLLAVGTTVCSLIIGVPLGFFIGKTDLLSRKVFGTLYLIPILIPPYIHAIVWTRLDALIPDSFSLDIYNVFGAVWVLTLAYFPFVTLTTISGLSGVDRGMEESSLLYHPPLRTVRKVTFPLVVPHILCGALFVFIFSIIDFGVPDLFRIRVYPVEIFIHFSALYDEKAASLLSYPLILVTLLAVLLQKYHMRQRSYVNLGAGRGQPIRYILGKGNPPAFLFSFVVLSLAVVLPVIVLFRESGSLQNYARVFTTSVDQISYSLLLATLGGLFTVALAFPVSHLIERTGRKGTAFLEYMSVIPFAIPPTILGVGLIKVWNRQWIDLIYNSSIIVVLAYVAHCIPFAIRLTSSGVKQLSPSLEEVGHLHSSSRGKVMRKILLPLCTPSLAVGFFITFVLSFGDLGTTLLVIPPGRETIPVKIYNLMHYGAEQMVAALCLMLIGIILVLGVLFLLVYRLTQRWLHAWG